MLFVFSGKLQYSDFVADNVMLRSSTQCFSGCKVVVKLLAFDRLSAYIVVHLDLPPNTAMAPRAFLKQTRNIIYIQTVVCRAHWS